MQLCNLKATSSAAIRFFGGNICSVDKITSRTIYGSLRLTTGIVHPAPSSPCAQQYRHATTLGSFASSNDGATDVHTAEASVNSQVPPRFAHKDPEAWMKLLDPFLPLETRHSNVTQFKISQRPLVTSQKLSKITTLLARARTMANTDLLAYLGATQGRHESMLWMMDALIGWGKASSDRQQEILANFVVTAKNHSGAVSLRDMTSEKRKTDLLQNVRDSFNLHTSTKYSFQDMLRRPSTNLSAESIGPERERISMVLLSTANLIIIASSEGNSSACDEIMSSVVSIMMILRLRGILQQPPSLASTNEKATNLKLPLATMLANFDALLKDAHDKLDPDAGFVHVVELTPSICCESFRELVKNIRPHVHLEFLLWSCINGGWFAEGAAIVHEAKRHRGPHAWTAFSWRKLSEANQLFEEEYQVQAYMRVAYNRELGAQPRISVEAVEALINGLIASTGRQDSSNAGYGLARVAERLSEMKGFLDQGKQYLQFDTWNTVIARFTECPKLDPEIDATAIEIVLAMSDTYNGGWHTHGKTTEVVPDRSKAHSATSSALVLGLYHRALLSRIRSRNVPGTLRLLTRLQSLTDANKRRSLQDFFQELRSKKLDTNSTPQKREDARENLSKQSPKGAVPGVEYAAMFPQIPLNVLAPMLDLFTTSGEFEVARWMVHTDDVDGPLIPQESYGDQVIAPALIRFAAASQDTALLAHVTRVQTGDVSGRTLVALCETRIQKGKWDGATDVFGLIRDYSLHDWTIMDLSTIVKSLLIQYAASSRSADGTMNGRAMLQASTMLQRLLRGDLGQVWGTEFSELDSLVAILCVIHPRLLELCSNLLPLLTRFRLNIPIEAFDIVLQGAVQAYGSSTGQRLWKVWCGTPDQSREIKLNTGSTPRLATRTRVFSSQVEALKENGEQDVVCIYGSVSPTLATLRIIIHQALQELTKERIVSNDITTSSSSNSSTDDAHNFPPEHVSQDPMSVLSWAAVMLREIFHLSRQDIDYELQGHFPSVAENGLTIPIQPLYSDRTLEIWKTFADQRTLIEKVEHNMRTFAKAVALEETIVEPLLSRMRLFVHLLAKDFGLATETLDTDEDVAGNLETVSDADSLDGNIEHSPSLPAARSVRVYRLPNHPAQVPVRTITEVMQPCSIGRSRNLVS